MKAQGSDIDELVFLIFKLQHDPIPVSVMVDGEGIELTSTMRNVLLNKIGDEPSLDEKIRQQGNKKVYFKITLKRAELVLNQSQFLTMTVRKILSVKNLSDPATIEIFTV